MDAQLRTLERRVKDGDEGAELLLKQARMRIGDILPMTLRIDGETYTVESSRDVGYTNTIYEIETEEGETFIVAEDAEVAGEAAKERWTDMVENDPAEFRSMVGDECLVNWALGQYAGPGYIQVNSLSDWLDLHVSHPEQEWAAYDSEEREIEEAAPDLIGELGFNPTVAYRSN